MKIFIDNATLSNFEAWSVAVDTKNQIIEAGKENEFDSLIDDLYPEGLSDTALNDLLWFEVDWIFNTLGITEESDDDENDEQ